MTHRRLCKFAEAVLAAEARREALEKALTKAESDLHAAFSEFFDDYLRKPYPIDLDEADTDKANRFIAIWRAHHRRRTRALFEEAKCLWPYRLP